MWVHLLWQKLTNYRIRMQETWNGLVFSSQVRKWLALAFCHKVSLDNKFFEFAGLKCSGYLDDSTFTINHLVRLQSLLQQIQCVFSETALYLFDVDKHRVLWHIQSVMSRIFIGHVKHCTLFWQIRNFMKCLANKSLVRRIHTTI